MRILIVHLSDFHIKESNRIPESQITALVKSFGDLGGVAAIEILFSGDIAFSGREEQYEIAKIFFEKITAEIKKDFKEKLHIFIVPGNHDICGLGEYRDINEADLSKEYKKHYEYQLEKMSNYYSFSKSVNNYDDDSQVVRIISQEIPREKKTPFKIRICLINSAPVSFLGAKSDKQFHNLETDDIEKIRNWDNCDLSIAVMHHSPEWFTESSRHHLDSALQSSVDMVFLGHDHYDETLLSADSSLRKTLFFKSGEALLEQGGDFDYSLVDFDMESNKFSRKSFSWNENLSLFQQRDEFEDTLYPKRGVLTPSKEFVDRVIKNTNRAVHAKTLLEYFVFPNLEKSSKFNDGASETVDNIGDFFRAISDKKIIQINGEKNSGKSALLKMCYVESIEQGYIPIYIDKEFATPSPNKLIEDGIELQFGALQEFNSLYKQIDKSRKILFIDDFDQIKTNPRSNKYDYIDKLLNYVGKVVFITSTDWSFDKTAKEIKESAKGSLAEKSNYFSCKICDFVKTKRDALINAVCKCEDIPETAHDYIVNIMDRVVIFHRYMVELNPIFILEYVRFIIDSEDKLSVNDILPLGKIYEDNIKNEVVQFCELGDSQERFAQIVVLLLQELAYCAHDQKNPVISLEDISRIVDKYNNEHEMDVNAKQFRSIAEKAGLLKERDEIGKYQFSDVNTLAFFVAKKIYSLITDMETCDIGIGIVNRVLDEICFNINERIAIFLSSFMKSKQLTMAICKKIDSLAFDEEFSFDDGTIRFLNRESIGDFHILAEESKSKRDKMSDAQESRLSKLSTFEYQGIYDYEKADVEKQDNQIVLCLKLLEMLSRTFVDSFPFTKKEEKRHIRSNLFKYSNIAIQEMLRRLDENFDEIVETLYGELVKKEEKPAFERESVEQALVLLAYMIIAGLFSHIAESCSKEDTVNYLDSFERDDTNSRVMKAYMHESADESRDFVNRICTQVKEARRRKNRAEEHMLKICANLHLSKHPFISYRERQQLGSVVFQDKNASKKALIHSAKLKGSSLN